ncbi:MAG: hypothetical protein JW751_03350 [Polyangiaceae bacterium]|nr:hypothetical protein [Polyangiaceae bacterium]
MQSRANVFGCGNSPARVSSGVRDLAASPVSIVVSLLMAKVKPAAVLGRGGHHV